MLLEAAQRTWEFREPSAFTCSRHLCLTIILSTAWLHRQSRAVTPARVAVLTMLHANIQDVFNEYGVQIRPPHYMADTAEAKVVKPEDWFREPAKKVTNLPSSSETSATSDVNSKES